MALAGNNLALLLQVIGIEYSIKTVCISLTSMKSFRCGGLHDDYERRV